MLEQYSSLQFYEKRDSDTGIFLFSKFLRTPTLSSIYKWLPLKVNYDKRVFSIMTNCGIITTYGTMTTYGIADHEALLLS